MAAAHEAGLDSVIAAPLCKNARGERPRRESMGPVQLTSDATITTTSALRELIGAHRQPVAIVSTTRILF